MLETNIVLVSGCSHTAGVGIEKHEIWAQCLANQLGLELVNLARPGACAKFVSESLIEWLFTAETDPNLVVAQWPNPYRSMTVVNHNIQFNSINSMDCDFQHRFKHNPKSFLEDWYYSIVALNFMCKAPVINVFLQDLDLDTEPYIKKLSALGIHIHTDQKIPNKTWHFDSQAKDGLHHSPQCHKRWADRILNILDHNT
jgi:hypothetical protein